MCSTNSQMLCASAIGGAEAALASTPATISIRAGPCQGSPSNAILNSSTICLISDMGSIVALAFTDSALSSNLSKCVIPHSRVESERERDLTSAFGVVVGNRIQHV